MYRLNDFKNDPEPDITTNSLGKTRVKRAWIERIVFGLLLFGCIQGFWAVQSELLKSYNATGKYLTKDQWEKENMIKARDQQILKEKGQGRPDYDQNKLLDYN